MRSAASRLGWDRGPDQRCPSTSRRLFRQVNKSQCGRAGLLEQSDYRISIIAIPEPVVGLIANA